MTLHDLHVLQDVDEKTGLILTIDQVVQSVFLMQNIHFLNFLMQGEEVTEVLYFSSTSI